MANRDNILHGAKLEESVPFTLGQVVMLMLETHGDKVLQVDSETGAEITASYIIARSKRIVRWLQHRAGFKPGDVIGIVSENNLDFCLIPISAFIGAFTLATFNPQYTADEFSHTLNLSKPSVIFCSPSSLNRVVSATGTHPFIKQIVVFGKNPHRAQNMIIALDKALDERFLDVLEHEEFESPNIDTKENIATILCSSGTTGMPKGVMTTQHNMVTFISSLRQVQQETLQKSPDQATIGLTPFFHSMGLMTMTLNLLGGSKSIVFKKFNFKHLLKVIQDYKIETIAVPPPIVIALCQSPLTYKYDLSSLKIIRCGAAPLPIDYEREAAKKYKLETMGQGYGMTETTLSVCLMPYHILKPGSVGLLMAGMSGKVNIIPSVSCQVINENGKALGPNQEGELCFKGPLIMKGYVNDPIATANTIDSDDWLHTGDIGYYDNEGFFYVVDRVKELIKYKAYQVPPAELEAALMMHPAVLDAAVIGIPDEQAGELPFGYVVLKPGQEIKPEQLQEFVKGKVSYPKYLRGGIRFIDSIPRNPSGKILRRVLKQMAIQAKSKL